MVLSNEHLKKICRLEQGKQCRFIVPGPKGLECGKGTEIEEHINWGVKTGKPGPSGDNCEGKGQKREK